MLRTRGDGINPGRVVDFNALKDDDDPDDPMVTFVFDGSSAYYQVPEEEEF